MPGAIRPNEKLAKIVYKLLKTPKEMQQHNTRKPTEEQKQRWFKDSSSAQ